VLVLLLTVAFAADLDVGTNGTYITIQSALDFAEPGDVLILENEDFEELLDIQIDVSIDGSSGATISAPIPSSPGTVIRVSGGAAVDVLDLGVDGAEVHRCFEVDEDSFIGVSGVSTQNCVSPDTSGGASLLVNGASLATVSLSTFDDPIFSPTGVNGGHMAVLDGSTLDIGSGSTISNGLADKGGAIYVLNSELILFDVAFADNNASDGGVVHVEGVSGVASADIQDTTFEGGGSSSGQLAILNANLVFENSSFADMDFGAQALFMGLGATGVVRNVSFSGARTSVFVEGQTDLILENIRLCNVDTPNIRIEDSTAEIDNLMISEYAGDLEVLSSIDSTVEMRFATFVGNPSGFGPAVRIEDGDMSIHSSVFYQFDAAPVPIADSNNAVLTVDYSVFSTTASHSGTGFNLVDTDPRFREVTLDGDCGGDDLRPAQDSPLLGGGHIAHANPDGSPADIGYWSGANAPTGAFDDNDGDDWAWKYDCDDDDDQVNPDILPCDADCDGTSDEDPTLWFEDKDGDGFGGLADPTCFPSSHVSNSGDCNDYDNGAYPDAPEQCDSFDNDCDGIADDGLWTTVWYADNDDDGYGDPNDGVAYCDESPWEARAPVAGDCDDSDDKIYPGATEICLDALDQDCDGIDLACEGTDSDGDGYCEAVNCTDGSLSGDCDDNDNQRHPAASDEDCDGVDNNCDGEIDDEFSTDLDGDGYQPAGACTGSADDCDDSRASVHPNADEICNAYDDDCDGDEDEGLVIDVDDDGFPNANGCWGRAQLADCDDDNGDAWPGQTEIPNNGIDDNCDGVIDESDPGAVDNDGDGYCELAVCVGDLLSGDCNDNDATVSPGSIEVLDGVDNNCSGTVDDLPPVDLDGDGHTASGGDCNDWDADVHPDAVEVCNGFDDDCDGYLPTDEWDLDGDNASECQGDCDDSRADASPWLSETCGDGIDNNCDGTIDTDADADGDGFTTCSGDCDDTSDLVHPGAHETCNLFDDDCDGLVDEGYDLDGDGVLTCVACPALDACDCDDLNALVAPGRAEVCSDGLDNDCSGAEDDDGDADADGYTMCEGDCNDADPYQSPGSAERCDGKDNDCDGVVDDGYDHDKDNVLRCQGDCDDSDGSIYAGAEEICDDLDNDCDQLTDEGLVDCNPFDTDTDTDTDTPSSPGAFTLPPGWFCATSGGPTPWWISLLVVIAMKRRRRAASSTR
jgi:hypothetical protein